MRNEGYHGVHAGDVVTLEEVRLLADELAHLDGFKCDSQANTEMIRAFREQMLELVGASLAVNRPIRF
jgi:hypothetical protein